MDCFSFDWLDWKAAFAIAVAIEAACVVGAIIEGEIKLWRK